MHRHRSKKHGVASVELAICLPVIVIIVLGALSASSMIFMRQAVVQSAYETIKEAIRTDGTVASALQRGNDVLNFRNITPTSIVFDPADPQSVPRGTPVTVTLSLIHISEPTRPY